MTIVVRPRQNARRAVRRWLSAVLMLAVGLICAALLTFTAAAKVMGWTAVVVKSGSMTPSVAVGDVLITEQVPARQLAVGDIVTFADRRRPGRTITHRVRRIDARDGRLHIRTRGDANRAGERWTVASASVAARTVCVVHLPLSGLALHFNAALASLRAALTVLASVATFTLVLGLLGRRRRRPVVHDLR